MIPPLSIWIAIDLTNELPPKESEAGWAPWRIHHDRRHEVSQQRLELFAKAIWYIGSLHLAGEARIQRFRKADELLLPTRRVAELNIIWTARSRRKARRNRRGRHVGGDGSPVAMYEEGTTWRVVDEEGGEKTATNWD